MKMGTDQAKAVGERIVSAREALGWSQTELAQRAGFTDNTVRKVERGDRVAPLTLRKVLDTVGLEPLSDVQKRAGFPADIQLVLDLVGMYLVARPEEDRAAVAYDLTRFLMKRDAGGHQPNG